MARRDQGAGGQNVDAPHDVILTRERGVISLRQETHDGLGARRPGDGRVEPPLCCGLTVSFTLYVDLDWRTGTTKTPLFSVGSEPSRVHRLLPLRALRDRAMSLAFVEASLTTIRDAGARGLAPTHALDFVFAELFPSQLLDLELDRDTLVETVIRRVTKAMGDE